MAANKDSLLVKFKKQIDENIKNGATTSKELRQGIPTSFTASDGKLYRLQNVSRYFRTSTNDKTKTLNPTFLDVELNKEVTAARANALKIQTSPNVEKWNPKTDAVEGLEAHHKRMVKMYAPFYEGLNEKQAQELTQWFVDEGVPLGDAKTNLKNLSPKVHKEIHKWMIENNIQVRPDKTGKGNFVTLDKGPGKGTSFVKGSEGVAVKAVMPSFKDLPINARFPLISNWLTYVQDPIDSKLSELEWDEYRSKHPIKPRDAAQIPEIAAELAEEAKHINPARVLTSALENPWVRTGIAGVGIWGMGLDIQAAEQDWRTYKEDTNGDNLANAIGSTAVAIDQISPFGIVGQTINYAVRNGNNGDGMNGSLGINGLTDHTKKAETYEKEESEITNGWYEDSLEDRQLNGSKYTKRLLKAI